VLACPFCGAPETDRFDLEGRRFLVFGCMFTPAVDPRLSEPELSEYLRTAFAAGASGAYFRRTCDRLHLYVTQGEGGRALRGAGAPSSGREDE
jgi:hypothetical protein